MANIDSNSIDIRQRVREHHLRQARVAALTAPADWEAALRTALAAERKPQPPMFSMRDVSLFLQSFTIAFVSLMVFLF